jgi:predicted component of type VI protein secretion system
MNGTGAKLVVHGSLSAQDEYELPEGTTKIGREAFNDIVLYDPEVSRNHALIKFHEGRYVIEDLGSTNGTFINGRRITAPMPLHNGDVIDMGEGVSATFYGLSGSIVETVVQAEEQDDLDKTMAEPETPIDVSLAPTAEEPLYVPQAATQVEDPEYEPPAVQQAELKQTVLEQEEFPQTITPPEQELPTNRRRYLAVSSCLFFLFIVACAASLFLLDSLAPDFLYCGPARPLAELAGLNCP